MRNKPFKLPKSFLSQLDEFTEGYLLFVKNNGTFETYGCYPDDSAELGLVNFADIQTGAMQEALRQAAIDAHSTEEDDEGEESVE